MRCMPSCFEAVDYADDIDQGVGGAEFVEVDLLKVVANRRIGGGRFVGVDVIGVAAVDAGLGGEEGLQDGGGAGAGLVGQGGGVGYGFEHLRRGVAGRGGDVDQGAGAADFAAGFVGCGDIDVGDVQGGDGVVDGVEGRPASRRAPRSMSPLAPPTDWM